MSQFRNGYRSIGVLIGVNADLLIFAATLAVALFTAGYLASL